MILNQFWLTDAQFSKTAPHLFANSRGKARVDDRGVISGIVHVLESGERWIDALPEYGRKKTLYNLDVRWAVKGGLGRFVRRARASGRTAVGSSHRLLGSEGASLGLRRQWGGEKSGHRPLARRPHDQNQPLDRRGARPIAFMLTSGNVANCRASTHLLARLPACEILHGDKGYDSDAIR